MKKLGTQVMRPTRTTAWEITRAVARIGRSTIDVEQLLWLLYAMPLLYRPCKKFKMLDFDLDVCRPSVMIAAVILSESRKDAGYLVFKLERRPLRKTARAVAYKQIWGDGPPRMLPPPKISNCRALCQWGKYCSCAKRCNPARPP